jgi:hypothetical protein
MKKQLWDRLNTLEQSILQLTPTSSHLIDCALANVEKGNEDKVANVLIGLKEYIQYYESEVYNQVSTIWRETSEQ